MDLARDIKDKVLTLTAKEFCDAMGHVWGDVCLPSVNGGLVMYHLDDEAYELYHNANVLAKVLGLELLQEGEEVSELDGPANVWRLPCGELVGINAEHGGVVTEISSLN